MGTFWDSNPAVLGMRLHCSTAFACESPHTLPALPPSPVSAASCSAWVQTLSVGVSGTQSFPSFLWHLLLDGVLWSCDCVWLCADNPRVCFPTSDLSPGLGRPLWSTDLAAFCLMSGQCLKTSCLNGSSPALHVLAVGMVIHQGARAEAGIVLESLLSFISMWS